MRNGNSQNLSKLPKIHAMIVDDSAPCGRNAQTLSGPEGSSNRDAYNRRGIRVLKVFFSIKFGCPSLHIGKPY